MNTVRWKSRLRKVLPDPIHQPMKSLRYQKKKSLLYNCCYSILHFPKCCDNGCVIDSWWRDIELTLSKTLSTMVNSMYSNKWPNLCSVCFNIETQVQRNQTSAKNGYLESPHCWGYIECSGARHFLPFWLLVATCRMRIMLLIDSIINWVQFEWRTPVANCAKAST